ncbi:hypothetical protein DFJ58DRAFT_840241 [Suillus subalutaceus]|uniref:uncharacterized protein n=1 Tax=Suillus subalutaceus TaxID=48586 RepID=UPI001B8683DC|nr:uncharacterized protein DFJ58DRAFT_840241 [Suillus subalutaceus]KAG1859382.1 hypothetical protein DFJ58DRAFT_840241 [Suillus subalutaceus]
MSSLTPRRTRKAQLASSGLGSHFVSPRKARDKRKTQTYVELPGAETKRRRLLDAMERLLKPQHEESHPQLLAQAPPSDTVTTEHMDTDNLVVSEFHSDEQPSLEISVSPVKRRIVPDKSTNSLYKNWIALIPTLVDPVLQYFRRTQGKALENIHPVISACGKPSCTPKRTTMMCLFFDRFTSIDVLSCTCSTLQQVLVHHGLFPTAPSQPRMAVSVDLLSFYRALFERSCDAINALASALKNHYSRRGYQMTDAQGEVIQDPFRRGLGYAVQWYDILQVEVERQVETVVQQHRDRILHGRSTDEGGDIHVAMDGNFHHRHRRAAGDCPKFYDPTYFLPKTFVDTIGRHIDTQRKRPVRSHVPLVPDEAVDQCENAYEAADGKKQKAAMDSFDDTGIMALICRHDIPLFFANIDSPGEQQKYSVALLQHFFSLLPPEATVVALYDVGCVLARTLSKHEILPKSITSRLRFATTAMHAYGHEWACQLVYNPRICVGLGLSDGEGTERLWSRLVRLIGVERTSSRQRRLWLIDRQAVAIASEMRTDLGDWIKRRLRRGIKGQGSAAQDALDQCEVSIEELQAEWSQQRQSQLSIRAQGVGHSLSSPGRSGRLRQSIANHQDDVGEDMASDDTLEALESLERGHNRLMNKVEALYSSLNVHDRFPELHGINLEFVRILLMARDLKMNIEQSGGAQQALGLMEDVWITPSHGEVPWWLDDTSTRDGIRALLKRDRCREEQVRLGVEADNLCRFFGNELGALELALRSPNSEPFAVLLQQRHANFICLQTRWSNCLASSVRFTNEVSKAVAIATTLSGGSPNMALHWINASMLVVSDSEGCDELPIVDPDHCPQVDSEQAALADVLEGEMGAIELDDDDSTNYGRDANANLLVDDFCVPSQEPGVLDPAKIFARIRPSHDRIPRLEFDPKEIGILSSPTACLNDTCINNCTILLWCSQLNTSAARCAILSTHDLPRIRYNAPDDNIWRHTMWIRYWEKDIWVLPIHRPSGIGHWVMCVIQLSTKELYLFDSMGDRTPWQSDVKDIMRLIARFLAVVRQHGHHVHIDLAGWVARPLNTKRLQNNDFDCGVWVLAAIFAVIRGSRVTGLHEQDMGNLRRYVRSMVLALPALSSYTFGHDLVSCACLQAANTSIELIPTYRNREGRGLNIGLGKTPEEHADPQI